MICKSKTFDLSHLKQVLSCEVDHNLVGHKARHTRCCSSAEIAISTETTKEKIGVSIDHDLLLFSQ